MTWRWCWMTGAIFVVAACQAGQGGGASLSLVRCQVGSTVVVDTADIVYMGGPSLRPEAQYLEWLRPDGFRAHATVGTPCVVSPLR